MSALAKLEAAAMSNGDTNAAVMAELAALRAENERLRARSNGRLTIKVASSGGVSVYGIGRFPVTLYQEQWARVLGAADEITAFIAAHKSELKVKA